MSNTIDNADFYALVNDRGIQATGTTKDQAVAAFVRDAGEQPDPSVTVFRPMRPSLYRAMSEGQAEDYSFDRAGFLALRSEVEAEDEAAQGTYPEFYALSNDCGIQAIGTSADEAAERYEAEAGEEFDFDEGSVARMRRTLYEAMMRTNDWDSIRWHADKDGVLALSSELDAETKAAEALAASREDELDALIEQQGWCEGMRREMLRAMAKTVVFGGAHADRVAVSNKGKLAWTAAAPRRSDRAAVRCPLNEDPEKAADEMAENLGLTSWRAKLAKAREEVARKRFEELERLGKGIFGDEWISPMAREVGVEVRTVQRWAAAKDAPPWLPGKLTEIARRAVENGAVAALRNRAEAIEAFAAAA